MIDGIPILLWAGLLFYAIVHSVPYISAWGIIRELKKRIR